MLCPCLVKDPVLAIRLRTPVVLVFTGVRRLLLSSSILAANKRALKNITKMVAKGLQHAVLNGHYWVFRYCSCVLCQLNNENFTLLFVFPKILFPEFRWGKLIGWKEMLYQAGNDFPEEQLQEGFQTLSRGLIGFSVYLVFCFMTDKLWILSL